MRVKCCGPACEDQAAVWRVPGLVGVDLFKASFKRFAYGRHTHASYALGLIETGAQTFRHGSARHLAPSGTIIAVNPGEAHDGEAAGPGGYGYRMLYVDPGQSLPGEEPPASAGLRSPAIQDPRLARSLASLLHRLDGEAARAGASGSLELQSRLLVFWRRLWSRHGSTQVQPTRMHDARVRRARDYLAANACHDVQLADLAGVAGLSPFHFLRRFTAAYGLTPHACLMAVRLEAARERLAAGEPIAQAAAATGFADQAHLTRRFKAAHGLTPGRFAAGLTAIPFKTRQGSSP